MGCDFILDFIHQELSGSSGYYMQERKVKNISETEQDVF